MAIHEGQKNHKCESQRAVHTNQGSKAGVRPTSAVRRVPKSKNKVQRWKIHEKTSQPAPKMETGYKNPKCDSCGNIYLDTESLKKHINAVHKGKKDYRCESCGKSFSDVRHLKKHIPVSKTKIKATLFKYIVYQKYYNHFS